MDNQIRFRLWSPFLPLVDIEAMGELVLEAHEWDCRRGIHAMGRGSGLSAAGERTHGGMVFDSCRGLWRVCEKKSTARARGGGANPRGVGAGSCSLSELKKRGDGIALLKASTLIAHNLGDLDRVVDMWKLPDTDPFKRLAYKAGHEDPSRFQGALVEAGALNKAFMADENHRHFVLRGPKCLRRSPELLLPVGPFFDEWGSRLAKHPALTPEEVAEVAEALVDGWEWFRKKKQEPGARPPVGYGRALAGILESFPGGMNRLSQYLPPELHVP